MPIIAVSNQKGGVGKTTTTVNLAAALGMLGKRVLLIDMDPQGSLAAGLGLEPDSLDMTIYNALLTPEMPIRRVIRPYQAYIDLIPANIDLASAEIELVAEIRRELILRRILEPLGSWYDFILIDCPPSLGLLTANSLCASQEVLIPLQCEYFAMRGIRLLLSTIDKIKARLNPELRILGILPTMYATGTIHAREVVEEMRAVFGEQIFDIVIQKSIRFPEATVANQAMLDYASKHQGTRAYQLLAQRIVGSEPETTPDA